MDPAPALSATQVRDNLGSRVLSAFPALVPRRPGEDTVVAAPGRAALCGVPAEVEALDLHLLESASMRRNADHLSQAIAPHLHDHYRRAHQQHLYQELGAFSRMQAVEQARALAYSTHPPGNEHRKATV